MPDNFPISPDFPIEEVARYPLPGMSIPASLQFSPDDRLITYLFSPEGSLVRQLYAFDPLTGERRLLLQPPAGGASEENLSLEEALRRERQRQRELGVTSYAWAEQGNRLLAPLPDGIYVQDGPDAPLRKLVDGTSNPALDAQFSPDGAWVAYVQEGELCVVPSAGGEPRRLTHGAGEDGLTHGLAEYIAQEEMGRGHGFWWSPGGHRLAFTEVDERHIPIYPIIHQGKDFTGEGACEVHRYPFAGQANATVRLGIVSLQGGDPLWLNLGEEDGYLARVDWLPDGSLTAQVENRAQTRLELLRFDPDSGERTLLLSEESQMWINLHKLFRPLKDGRFIWASERTGFQHLYLYSAGGELLRPLTEGEWLVEEVVGVDEVKGQVYFTGTLDGPLECHLYAVSLAGGSPRRLTVEAGTHAVVCDHACRRFVDTWQALDQPPVVRLKNLQDGSLLADIYAEVDPRVAALNLQPPEPVSFQNRTGVALHGLVYLPSSAFGPWPYPTIVMVYGGPHAQMVSNSWVRTVTLRAQYLRSLGYLVFVMDNRGSARRGLAFEGALKYHLGSCEVDDQVDGVRWLASHGLADPERVGIFGWSYGGYMAAMCLASAPDTFKVAVAGAPVTHWDGYDTHYTERYMGTPQSNPQGYRDSSVMQHVSQLRGRLLLVHGLIDENVHFRHSARLINALIQNRKPYDLLLFPDERHMPRRLADRVYQEEIVCGYFQEHL